MKAVSAAVSSGVYVNTVRNLKVISVTLNDGSGRLNAVWFNAPYLRSTLKKGQRFCFPGQDRKKKRGAGTGTPGNFHSAAYSEVLHSMQPIYRLTAGLTNKMVSRLVRQALSDLSPQEGISSRGDQGEFHLADINFALGSIHFPENMEDLLAARKRLVFDEFLLFILSVSF